MSDIIFESLVPCVGEELASELISYIEALENETEFDNYIIHFLDLTDQQQQKAYENIKSYKFGHKNSSKNTKKSNQLNNVQENESNAQPGKKGTKKFTKFHLSELQKAILKEGRNPCECQATKHKLINNCIECGRIVCEQEGSGPCFFCGNLVCNKEEQEMLSSDTKQAKALHRTLTERKKSDGWKKAIEQRNKMLEFDKNCAKRTTVIDDELDYFEMNRNWLSKKECEDAEKKYKKEYEKKYGSRLGARKITIDLLGRQAVEDNSIVDDDDDDDDYDEVAESVAQEYVENKNYPRANVPNIDEVLESLQNLNSSWKSKECGIVDDTESFVSNNDVIRSNYVIQDKEYLEMRDMGMCLSMHQPWASLLVTGIKKHEGRTWYTPHRGTLWIASAAKPPEQQTIVECEQFYQEYYNGKQIHFPDEYPTGYLLGCVRVEDCLSQDEYREQYPNGESDSPFVLVCSNPKMLPFPFQIQGDHKIYKLKSDVHKRAREAIVIKRRC